MLRSANPPIARVTATRPPTSSTSSGTTHSSARRRRARASSGVSSITRRLYGTAEGVPPAPLSRPINSTP